MTKWTSRPKCRVPYGIHDLFVHLQIRLHFFFSKRKLYKMFVSIFIIHSGHQYFTFIRLLNNRIINSSNKKKPMVILRLKF